MNEINPKHIYEISKDCYSWFWDADTILDNKALQFFGFIIALLGIISSILIAIPPNRILIGFIIGYFVFSIISAGVFIYSFYIMAISEVCVPNFKTNKIDDITNSNNELISWARDYVCCKDSLRRLNQRKSGLTFIAILFFMASMTMLLLGVVNWYMYG